MITTPFQLNKLLLEATISGDLERTRQLLKQGADPLGSTDALEAGEHLLGELFCDASEDAALAQRLPEWLELFFAHGMDLRTTVFPDADIDPLWTLAFVQNESGLNILETLLEHGLNHRSAEQLVGHILFDLALCDSDAIDDESTGYGLKMVMLTASYPHVLRESPHIAAAVELEKNDASMLPGFRDRNRWSYTIVPSACGHMRNATLTITDKETHQIAWIMQI